MKYILVLLFSLPLGLAAQDEILGDWLSQAEDGITRIYKQDGKYHGKVVWLEKPFNDDGTPDVDDLNPDPKLKNRPIMNLVLLKDFVFDDEEWEDGTIYDPNDGHTYRCSMWLESDKVLKVRGYWGFFWRTETWTRTTVPEQSN